MTEKRFFILTDEDDTRPCIRDRTFNIDDIYGDYKYDDLEEICNEFNCLNDENEQLKHDATVLIQANQDYRKENEQLKTQLQNTSDQRDEFHRGARENANRVGKLEKENEELKKEIEELKWNLELER